jgi:hypothetical protein
MRNICLFTLLWITTSVLFACFKDGTAYPAQCKLANAIYYNNGLVSDSTYYILNGSKITGLNTGSGTYRFAYDSIYIVKRNFYTVDTLHADRYDTILYNSNKAIRQIETYINLGSAYLLKDKLDFAYTNGKLASITSYDMASGAEVKQHTYEYIFSGANIISVNHTDYTGPNPVSTIYTYSHDANANYMQRQNEQAFIIDPFFNNFDGTLYPFAYDANNITNISSGNNSTTVTLDLDAGNKNLMDLKLNGILVLQYVYHCQ